MAGLGRPALKTAPAPHSDAIFAEIIAVRAGRTLPPASWSHRLSHSPDVCCRCSSGCTDEAECGFEDDPQAGSCTDACCKAHGQPLRRAFACPLTHSDVAPAQTIAVATSFPLNAIQTCSLACTAARGLQIASVPTAGGTARRWWQFLNRCIC